METKFTPGPWKVRTSPMDSRLYIYAEDKRGEVPVVQTSSNTSPTTMNMTRSGEKAANACLIAAAPELYKALEALCADHFAEMYEANGQTKEQRNATRNRLLSDASAAIARARGRT